MGILHGDQTADAVELLLKHGASLTQKNRVGDSVLDIVKVQKEAADEIFAHLASAEL